MLFYLTWDEDQADGELPRRVNIQRGQAGYDSTKRLAAIKGRSKRDRVIL